MYRQYAAAPSSYLLEDDDFEMQFVNEVEDHDMVGLDGLQIDEEGDEYLDVDYSYDEFEEDGEVTDVLTTGFLCQNPHTHAHPEGLLASVLSPVSCVVSVLSSAAASLFDRYQTQRSAQLWCAGPSYDNEDQEPGSDDERDEVCLLEWDDRVLERHEVFAKFNASQAAQWSVAAVAMARGGFAMMAMHQQYPDRLHLLRVEYMLVPSLLEDVQRTRFYQSLHVDPASNVTLLMYSNGWSEAGMGYCSVVGDQLYVREKTDPNHIILQQTVSEDTQYQQDAFSLLTYAMGPSQNDEFEQVMALVFDSLPVANRVSAVIGEVKGETLPDFSRQPSPHCQCGHQCTGARVMMYHRPSRTKHGRGLVCVNVDTQMLTVYLEYEGEPSNFVKFEHKLEPSLRAGYERYATTGFLTLGGGEWALACDRREGTEHEENLWRWILHALSVAAKKEEERKRKREALVRARRAEATRRLALQQQAQQQQRSQQLQRQMNVQHQMRLMQLTPVNQVPIQVQPPSQPQPLSPQQVRLFRDSTATALNIIPQSTANNGKTNIAVAKPVVLIQQTPPVPPPRPPSILCKRAQDELTRKRVQQHQQEQPQQYKQQPSPLKAKSSSHLQDALQRLNALIHH